MTDEVDPRPFTSDDVVLRRVRADQVKPDGTPTSANFDAPPGEAMSVTLLRSLQRYGLSPEVLLETIPYDGVVSLAVSFLTDLQEVPEWDPLPPHPRHCGLTFAAGRRSQQHRRRLALEASWVIRPGGQRAG